MTELHYLGKGAPGFAFLYNEASGEWESFSSNNNIGVSGMDFKGAPQPQKATAQHLFVYDNTISEWRPMVSSDLGSGGGGSSLTGAYQTIASGATSVTVSGLGLDSAPTFINTTITRPSELSTIIFSSVRGDSITSDGFITDFSATIPATGYRLNYILSI